MGSVSELLLQNAIRQVESDVGLYSEPGFQQVRKTAGNHVDGNIYLSFKTSANLFSKIFNTEVLNQKGFKSDW